MAGVLECEAPAAPAGVSTRPAARTVARPHTETLWLVFAIAASFLLLFSVWDLSILRTGAPEGLRVFGSYWASGWAAAHHLNPYAIYPLTFTTPPVGHYGRILDLNLNPPALLPFFALLSRFDPNAIVRVWTLLSAALWIGSAAALVRTGRDSVQHRQIVWLLLAWPIFNSLWVGQIYALFTALAVAAWILLERHRQIAAGLCLGLLIAAKPNLALWALLLVFCGRRRAAATAALSAAALSAFPMAVYGPAVYPEWLAAVARDPHWMFPFEVSFIGVATRLGHREVGLVLAVLLLIGSFAFVAWKRPSLRNTSGIALSVAILASPLAWIHYVMLLAGPLLRQRWGWLLTLSLLALVPPFARHVYFLPVCLIAASFFLDAARAPSA
jgi:Glycosyltransferase family 87